MGYGTGCCDYGIGTGRLTLGSWRIGIGGWYYYWGLAFGTGVWYRGRWDMELDKNGDSYSKSQPQAPDSRSQVLLPDHSPSLFSKSQPQVSAPTFRSQPPVPTASIRSPLPVPDPSPSSSPRYPPALSDPSPQFQIPNPSSNAGPSLPKFFPLSAALTVLTSFGRQVRTCAQLNRR